MGRQPVWAILGARHVPRLLGSALIGRLPTGMAALAIVLLARERGAGYALAGVLAGLYAVGSAIGGPVLSRLVDRTRQPPVLAASAVLAGLAFVLLAVLNPRTAPIPAGIAVLIAGAATPPLEPCLRALWADILPNQRALHAAYSLDAAAQELVFVCGPLVVVGTIAVAGPTGGIVACAVLGLVGSVSFATARPSRVWRGVAGRRHWAGPLRSPRFIRLLAALLLVGGAVGIFTVGITAYAEGEGQPWMAGWLIALNGLGALVGGVAYTVVRPANGPPAIRLCLLTVGLSLGFLPVALSGSVWWAAPLAVLSGLFLPPVLACAFVLVDTLAPVGTVTEAFAWVVTAFASGNAIGSSLAGTLAENVSPTVALLAAVASGALAALTTAVPLARLKSQGSTVSLKSQGSPSAPPEARYGERHDYGEH